MTTDMYDFFKCTWDMISAKIKAYLFVFFMICVHVLFGQITVSSLTELAEITSLSNQIVTMEPGVYNMSDYLTPTVIANNTPKDEFGRRAMILFSGDNNTFDFTGVSINIDTELLNDLGGSVIEFHLTGNFINFKGLTVNDIGNSPTASGGQSFTVSGDDIIIEDVTLNMSGSSPYGYGDLLGKGGGALTPMRKHSGMLIGGLNVNVIGCSIYSTSFGHLFFVQGGRNVRFQNCYAEAVTRTTDDMLSETSGIAFDLGFAAVYPNYNGDKMIPPGYTKSLSECGFRTYGSGAGNTTSGITFENCIAKNARVGFALEVGAPILVKDCTALGCEAGYNVKEVVIENSKGDAVNGPLLYLSGDASIVDLYLMPEVPTTTLHASATIAGNNHEVSIKSWNDETRMIEHPILLGVTRPTGTNPFSPLGTASTTGVNLSNCTEMPVIINAKANANMIHTTSAITDSGKENIIDATTCEGTNVGAESVGLIDEIYNIPNDSEFLDPFYGWNPDVSGVYGFMSVDHENKQLVCTFEDYQSGYVRFYWRKLNPNSHKLNSDNYPILAMKGKRPDDYANFTLNVKNIDGTTIQYKDGISENGLETLSHSQLLSETSNVYYWDLTDKIPSTESWELSGFNCVNTGETDPVSEMRIDYIKTFKDLDELKSYEFSLNKIDVVLSDVKIYPNPMKDYITIQNFSGGRIVVRNILGEKVLERNVYNIAEMINVSEYKVGIYFIELKINGYKLNKKIIKI